MHLFLALRGIKHDMDRFITQLQGVYLPFKHKGEDKFVQTAVRPIRFYEIVFPEEFKDVMLTTCLGTGKKGEPQHKRHKKFVWMIRRMLGKGVEKIPDYKTDKCLPCKEVARSMEMIGIGIKKDRYETTTTKTEAI